MLSGNNCAFPNCSMTLVEESGILIGEICHIKAKNAGGKRYDASQTNKERDAFENLVLMCPVHHTVIDSDETIFTVEVLQQIKKNHEEKASVSNEQGNLEELLKDYLHSIIGKNNPALNTSKIIKEENSALKKAQKLAGEKEHNARREKWRYSYDGAVDAINSINEIYLLINENFQGNTETYNKLGIEFLDKDQYFRSIYDSNFISQIELKGYNAAHYYNNNAANITLELFLYKKTPTPYRDRFKTDVIKRYYLKPDLTLDGQVIWTEKEKTSLTLSAEEVCEKMFDLLISEISKKKPQENSWKDDYIRENGGW